MTRLHQTITRWQGTGLLTTTLLGTSVFILPQITVNDAGTNALWSWTLLTLALLPIAWVFGELGKQFPHAGGPAFFLERAFGSIYGQMIGLMFVLIVPIGAPAALMMTFEFVHAMVSLSPLQLLLGELMVLIALLLLNQRGMQTSGKLQLFLTLSIAAIVAALLIAYALNGTDQIDNISSNQGTISQGTMLSAAAIAFWSFLGIEAMGHLSAEFKNPKQDFIPAMLMGTVLVGIIYIACTFLVLTVPGEQNLLMIEVFNQSFGQGGAWVIGIIGAACGIATVNVYIASLARLVWTLSNQSILPSYYEILNQHGVPMRALISILALMSLTIIGCYLFQADFEVLILWTNGVFIILYLASMLAALRLLEKKFHIAAWFGIVVCCVLAFSLAEDMIYAFVLMAILFPALLFKQKTTRSK